MNDLNEAFKDAAQVYAERLKAQKEATENPKASTAENGQRFGEHLEAILQARREENQL